MGKIRVQDLAKMMGVPNQDLMFKLKSIGVRVEGEDAHIDTDIIQAILQGKKLPHPREVILRDEPVKGETASPAAQRRRRPAPRRPQPSPLRPHRPRTIIRQVESEVPTLPTTERSREAPPAERPAEAPAAAAPPAAETKPAAAPPAAVPPAEKPAAERPAAAAGPAAVRPAAKEDRKKAASPLVSGPPPQFGEAEEEPKAAEKKEKKRAAKRQPRTAEDEDLRAYRGAAVEDLEEAEEQVSRPAARRKRRAERRKEGKEEAAKAEMGGKVLTFRKGRPEGPVMITEGMTVRDFAEKLGLKSRDLIAALVSRGIIANINHVVDPELAEQIAADLGVEAMQVSIEEEIQLRGEQGPKSEGREPRGPVVTIMGHVDHGKTSLLDAIRESRVTESEHGGITQHIGAYQVTKAGKKIVFLDTPGHEAFTMMRSRGAKATDIVVLVVAADDGVMPQTVEAIDHARAAKVPLLVAINKIDKDNANQDRVKKELADHELLVEDWGGETVAVPISALKKEGIDELLEMILLTADLLELKASPELPAQGVVLEARKEVGRGIISTVLVQNGTLRVGDTFVSGAAYGRVRAMVNDLGERIQEAPPATPVEVTGFNDVPAAGDLFQVVGDESEAREIASYRQQEQRRRELAPTTGRMSLEQLYEKIEEGEVKELPVVLKADVQGSVEVLRDALQKLGGDKVRVNVIHAQVGAISTNDVILATASDAIVVGFNVRPERNASELAEKEGVDIRLHTVIYELTDELKKAMAGLLDPTFREVVNGHAEVREIFKVPKIGTVAGCHVVDGTISRSDLVRLLRDNVVVYDGRLSSLKRFKDDASEVRAGFDCGIGLERFQDVKPGDVIEAYGKEEVAAEL
jgi:translation initiation factor IF-2